MKEKSLKKISKIFEEVLAIDVSKRQEYLNNANLDQEILEEIESLLSFEEAAETLMNVSAVEFSKDFLVDKEENPLIGQKFGIYKVEKELGYGGMGAVYLAERIDKKFEQKVAIKMLRREFNTEKIRKRFRQEREIQAALTHANMATLLDAGTTDEGVPYLVMEYIEGVQIDKFCLENGLKLNERLKLFNKVCEAVSFAHRNLIIHRDIKPSNILVTNDGKVKLLDFGISKLIDQSDKTTKTITQLGAMTPEYASPEQVKGESVTTATDIYSLGVVLFKLLTGKLPYDTTNKSTTNILSEITNSQPTTPSEAMMKDTTTEEKISVLPRPPFSASQLRGDLDNIILKSLRKEPERRYESVERFADDIWRFIDGLPVSARSSTFSYRASKFYKRNKISVLASLFVFLSLFVGISIAIWQANVAREQARIAEIESAKLKEEIERSTKITKFMEKIIAYANPGPYAEGFESRGEAKLIEVLEEMRNKIDTDFANQPDIQAELHHKFAETYVQRAGHKVKGSPDNELKKAKYHADRAIKLRKQYYGEKHELVAKDMYYLWANSDESNPKLLAEAIQMMREMNTENLNLPYMLQSYSNRLWYVDYSELHEKYYKNAIPKPTVGKLKLAENYNLQALSLFREHYAEDHIAIIQSKCSLSLIKIESGEFIEAKKNFPFCRKEEKFVKSKDSFIFERNKTYSARLEKGLAQ